MVDLTNCDMEQIHIPGTIQEFGFLLIVSLEDLQIEQASQNISSFLDLSAEEILGKKIKSFLESKYIFEPLPDFKKGVNCAFVLELEHKISGQKILLEFALTNDDDYFVVEVTPLVEEYRPYQMMGSLSSTIDRIENSECLNELYHTVVEEIQNITRFDRVMIYQFDEECNGTVIAEKLSGNNIDSYRNHRFPSTDIPAQARKMLEENLLRFIPDVTYTPSSIIPKINPRTKKPTNLGKSLLRSPSPVHIEYLKNMEVGASLTISIMKDRELWGLIACQHQGKKSIGQSEKFAAQILGKLVSSLITSKVHLEDFQYSQNLLNTFDQLHQKIESTSKLYEALTKRSPTLLDLNPVVGSSLAMCYDGKWFTHGDTPSKDEILKLVSWIKSNGDDEVFVTDSLQRIYPPSLNFKSKVSGLLAINFPYGRTNFILWFRPEIIGTVTWAGNPQKTVETRTGISTLHPRQSFEGWEEEVRLKSVPWKKSEIEVVKKLKRSIIEYELLRQYKEFQILADSVDHYIWVSSPDGTPEYYNKRWMEVTGLTDDFYNEANQTSHLIHPDDLPKMRDSWMNSIKNGIPYTAEMRIKTSTGDYQWVLTRTTPSKNEKGEIIKWYGSGINIDHIKKIEEELNNALAARDEFISLASHELKTPITSLGLLLELSYRTLKKSNVIAPYIERSVKELKRLRYLVDDLLDVSKITSGKMDLLFHQNDLSKIIFSVLERYQGEKRLDHLLSKFEKMPVIIVECDEFRIEQVLTNLISNALKYGDGKQIDIDLSDEGDSVVFIVKDQGIGISPEDQGRVFDRFERVGQNSGISGLGLGLYICKNIIDAHHGKIKVQSDLGKGTAFEVKLKKKLEL